MLPFKSNIFVDELWLIFLQSGAHTDYRTSGTWGKKGGILKENRLEIASCEAGFLKWLALN